MRALGQVLIQYDYCPYKNGKFGQRHAGRRQVKMKAELKVMFYKPRSDKDC